MEGKNGGIVKKHWYGLTSRLEKGKMKSRGTIKLLQGGLHTQSDSPVSGIGAEESFRGGSSEKHEL